MDFWKLQKCDNLMTRVTDIKRIDTSNLSQFSGESANIRLCWASQGTVQFLCRNKVTRLRCDPETCVVLNRNEHYTVTALENPFRLLVLEVDGCTVLDEMLMPLSIGTHHQNISKETQAQFRLLEAFAAAEQEERNALILNAWCSLLLADIRRDFEREYKDILLSPNGVVLVGNTVVTQEHPFEINFSDVTLKVESARDETSQEVLFKSKNSYIERPMRKRFSDKSGAAKKQAPYFSFCANEDAYYKIWFFHEETEKIRDVSPFEANVKLCFSAKASQRCKFMIGISSCVEYEMVGSEVVVDRCDQWIDYEVTLFEGEKLSTTNTYILSVVDYINTKFRSKLTTSDIAAMIHLHPSYLSRIFKEYTGSTISRFINARRITEAKQLLRKTDWTVETIAVHIGFYDTHHFQKCFRAHVGCSPSEYRKGVLGRNGGEE